MGVIYPEHPLKLPHQLNGLMDAGSGYDLAAKGSAIELEIAGSGPVSYCF